MKEETKAILKGIIFCFVIIVIVVGALSLDEWLFPSHETEKQYLLNRLEPNSPYDELVITYIYEVRNGWHSISYYVWDDDNGTSHYGSFKYHFVRDKFTDFDNDVEYIYDTYKTLT